MSLTGKATAKVLRGRINRLDTLCLSAYAIAVKNGFEGTEEEWLASLKGEKGEKGDKGDKGASGSTPSLSNYYTKNETDQKYLPKVLQEAQEPPVFLFGGDTGGYSSFKASCKPEPNAVPYYDYDYILRSSSNLIYDEEQVLTYGMLHGMFLRTYYLVIGEDGNYVIYEFSDILSYEDISAQCYDSFTLCVLHVDTEEYKQVIGMRIDFAENAIYFGNDEYKMTPDNVITKLK